MQSKVSIYKLRLRVLVISSLITGFLIIPIHEFGHVICHWVSGNPAGMSYARDYMLKDGEFTLLGIAGGILLPLFLAIAFLAVIQVKDKYYEILIPLIILGSLERAIQYTFGITPSDERYISDFLSLNIIVIKGLLVAIPLLINILLIRNLIHINIRIKQIVVIYLIVFASYVIMAIFGIFIIEKNIFPDQFMIQFG